MEFDARVSAIIKEAENIAVVGCSPKSYRDSNSVARYLVEQGYRIIPVNPKHDMILGVKSYPDLPTAREAEGPIDIVDVFRAPEHVVPHVREAVEIEARLIWLQLGIENEEASRIAAEAAVPFVQDSCLRVKHQELRRQRRL